MNTKNMSYEEKAGLLKNNKLDKKTLSELFDDHNPQIKKYVIENKGMEKEWLEDFVLKTREEPVLVAIAKSPHITLKVFKKLLETKNKEVLLALSERTDLSCELKILIGDIYIYLLEQHNTYKNDEELVSNYTAILLNVISDPKVNPDKTEHFVGAFTSLVGGNTTTHRKKII